MALIDLSGLTLNAEEARLASEAIFERVFQKKELNVIHGIRTGITMNTQIPFLGKFAPFLLADPGSCGTNTVSQTIATTQKYWNPKLLSGRLTHCQGDQTDTLWKMWRAAKMVNTDEWEKIDSEEMAFLEDRLLDAVYEDILLKTMFGDTAAANVSGGGDVTNGKNAALLTPFDGFWKQILTGVAATTVYRYTIPENAAASKAAQAALATDRAYLAMADLFDNSDSRIQDGSPVFQVSRSMYNNYIRYLESKSLSWETVRLENGVETAAFNGVPIIMRNDLDRNIKEYFDNGTTYLDPHRIIYTDINNLPIGTLDTESFSKFDMWYERKDKQHYIDSALSLDAKLLEEYMIAVAY